MAIDPRDLACELMRRRKVELEAADRRAIEIRGLVNSEVAALLAEGVARRAWLIGSLAWGNFGVRSDVDLVLEELAIDRIGATSERIASRVHASVDVLRIEEIPAAFRRRVLAEGVELVA
jgi:predicted nucleotidyltransferase